MNLPILHFLEIFSVAMTNFHPKEPSTKGKLIGNEASQKIGFGDSDPPLMIWLAGRLAGFEVTKYDIPNGFKRGIFDRGFVLLCFGCFSDLGPKWSGKGPNGALTNDKYSQTPYSDLWTDSGKTCI